MRRKAVISALLLVAVGVVLGATVFRTDIAQATGLKQSQSVIVDNTAAQAVPVREQNTDGDGNIKVHEQGTVQVVDSQSVGRAAVYYAGGFLPAVPAGQRVIVTYITARAERASGAAGVGCVIQNIEGNSTANIGYMRLLPTSGTEYLGSEQVFIRVDAGQRLALECNGGGAVSNFISDFGGYMIPST